MKNNRDSLTSDDLQTTEPVPVTRTFMYRDISNIHMLSM